MNVSFEGVAQQVATFEVDTSGAAKVAAGDAAALTQDGKIKPCPVSTAPIGVVLAVEGDVAAVQVAGYMRFPCADALTVGYAQLSLDASGELAAGSGRGGLVTDISGGTCGVIFC